VTPDPTVVPLAGHQDEAAGDLLARAFADDPLVRYLFPDGSERGRLLHWYYTALVRYGRLAGAVDVAAGPGERVVGAAVWLRSEGPGDDPAVRLERLERAGLLQAPAVLGEPAFGRLVAVVNHLEGHRRRAVPGAHWYLNQVGVDPGQRGRGTGSALLRQGLARAAAAGRPSYLETFREANLSFYRRLGFEVVVVGVEPASGLPFWTCLREAASQPVFNAR
jgi:ribosomal protein S18 acetylase RimI-like enzyme